MTCTILFYIVIALGITSFVRWLLWWLSPPTSQREE